MSAEDIDSYLQQFERDYFQSQSLPDDLKKLITYKLSNNLARVFETIEVKIRDLGETYSSISHDYLNDVDRANPDIMANVKAMDEISTNMGIVALGNSGPEGVIGFWPMDADNSDLFSLDTEGQYHLCLGPSFSETLYFETIVNEYEAGKAECETLFRKLDIPFPAEITKDEIWTQIDARQAALTSDPQVQRNSRYYEIKAEQKLHTDPQPELKSARPSEDIKDETPPPEKGTKRRFWKFWK